ncbi:hypothetical protein TRVL_10310 [Trypanosoma vivax]|nr:hypothetical protein TRVL_10310 [Trypanosoma vivax]
MTNKKQGYEENVKNVNNNNNYYYYLVVLRAFILIGLRRTRDCSWTPTNEEGSVERNRDPILASHSGTLKQVALVGQSAPRTRIRMALALHTPIRFAAAEGEKAVSSAVGDRCLFAARMGFVSGSSGVWADGLSSLKSSFEKLAS